MTARLTAHQDGQLAATWRGVAPGPKLCRARFHKQSPGLTTTSPRPGGTAAGGAKARGPAGRAAAVGAGTGQSSAKGEPCGPAAPVPVGAGLGEP